MNFTYGIIFGFSFIFLMTTLGAGFVYFFKKDVSPKAKTLFLGFASGVMIAASVWSLLIPAIEASAHLNKLSFLPAAVGFVTGGLFLVLLDAIAWRLKNNSNLPSCDKSMSKSAKLYIAVTMHNIPEGLAVGFAFGVALQTNSDIVGALSLAFGIGIQNLPEGIAVALPIKNATKSNNKAFLYGMSSGIVEPIFAVVGLFLASYLIILQPWLLSFAAGAMIFVVAEDLIPDGKLAESPHLCAWGVMIGFVIMMTLDVALA